MIEIPGMRITFDSKREVMHILEAQFHSLENDILSKFD